MAAHASLAKTAHAPAPAAATLHGEATGREVPSGVFAALEKLKTSHVPPASQRNPVAVMAHLCRGLSGDLLTRHEKAILEWCEDVGSKDPCDNWLVWMRMDALCRLIAEDVLSLSLGGYERFMHIYLSHHHQAKA